MVYLANFNLNLDKLLSKIPLYQSEQVTSDLERGYNDRAYQTLWGLLGNTEGGNINSLFSGIMGTNETTYDSGAGAGGTETNRVQKSSVGKDSGAFKWVQEFITPEMFANSDSTFIAFGKPTYNENESGQEFNLVGMCQDISISTGINVVPFKELRSERTLILPLKTTPGSISLRRLLAVGDNAVSLANKNSGWAVDFQKKENKKLFGMLISFMSPGRTKDIACFYAERCLITGVNVSIAQGQFALFETINIVYDRLRDDVQVTDAEYSGLTSKEQYERDVMTGKI